MENYSNVTLLNLLEIALAQVEVARRNNMDMEGQSKQVKELREEIIKRMSGK